MTNQTLLYSYVGRGSLTDERGRAEVSKPNLSTTKRGPTLTIEEATRKAEQIVRDLDVGAEFTVNGLFGHLRMRGDSRNRAVLLNHIRRKRMVVPVGVTRQDQENRNGGYAMLWRVTAKEYWEV